MTDKEYLQAIVREAVEDTLYEFKSDLKRDVAARNQYDKVKSQYGHTNLANYNRLPKYGDVQHRADSINGGDGRVHNKRGYHAQNLKNKVKTAVLIIVIGLIAV